MNRRVRWTGFASLALGVSVAGAQQQYGGPPPQPGYGGPPGFGVRPGYGAPEGYGGQIGHGAHVQPVSTPVLSEWGPLQRGDGRQRVSFRGVAFPAGAQVLYGGRPCAVESYSAGELVVTLPPNAQPSPFTIQFPGYQPYQTAPFVYGAAPVYRTRTVFVPTPNGGLVAVAPGTRPIGGAAVGVGPGFYGPPPRVTRYVPQYAPNGPRVVLYGENFLPGDEVWFGGRSVAVVERQPGAWTIEVPQGIWGGQLELRRGGRPYVLAPSYSIPRPPRLVQWGPQVGPPGTVVRFTVENLEGECRLELSGRPVAYRRLAPNLIEVTVPEWFTGAGTFVLHTQWTPLSVPQPFQVALPQPVYRPAPAYSTPRPGGPGWGGTPPQPPVVAQPGFPPPVVAPQAVVITQSPQFAPFGGQVVIEGSGFLPGDQVSFGGRILPSAVNGSQLVVTVPPGAVTDRFTVLRGGVQVAVSPQPCSALPPGQWRRFEGRGRRRW